MTSSDVWDADTARRYDDPPSPMFSPEVVRPTVDFLADLARDGPALEFAVGTGRVAVPLSQRCVPFEVSEPHTGFDTYDMATQQGTSHHYTRQEEGTYRYSTSNFRYVWPAECDLMARLAGLETVGRWADWDRAPFTADSDSHVSVWRLPGPN